MNTSEQTKEQRRIAIVNDAILQLQVGKYRTGQFGYISLPRNISSIQGEKGKEQAQSFVCDLLSEKEFCGVCAKGSLLLSTVRKENNLVLNDLVDSHPTLMKRLTEDELFDEYNLNAVEAFYENWRAYSWQSSSGWAVDCDDYCRAAVGFGFENEAEGYALKFNESLNRFIAKHPAEGEDNIDRTKRLLAILENMAANEGIFDPFKF